jgi:glutamate synthase domain-containing protein 2
MPGVKNTSDVVTLIDNLKKNYDVPVGIKIAGSDYIERELDVIAKTNADFIAFDGAEGGAALRAADV